MQFRQLDSPVLALPPALRESRLFKTKDTGLGGTKFICHSNNRVPPMLRTHLTSPSLLVTFESRPDACTGRPNEHHRKNPWAHVHALSSWTFVQVLDGPSGVVGLVR